MALTSLKPERILRHSKVLVVLDQPLQVEMKSGQAFSAPSVKSGLLRPMYEAGIARTDVQLTYLVNFMPPNGNLLSSFYTKESTTAKDFVFIPGTKNIQVKNYLHASLKRLQAEIALVQPDVIVVSGKWSLLLLTDEVDLTQTAKSKFGTLLNWRGSHLKLSSFWKYDKTHVVVPILPPSASFILAEAAAYSRFDFARIAMIANNPEKYSEPPWMLDVATQFDGAVAHLHDILLALEGSKKPIKVSVDIETERGYMDSIAFSIDIHKSITIPLAKETEDVWTYNQELELTELMICILMHKNTEIVGQNFSYDMQYIHRFWGITIVPKHDTLLLQHVLSPAMKKDLATLSSMYCSYHKYWKEEGKLAKGATRQSRWAYNGKDVNITLEISNFMDDIYNYTGELQEPLRFQTDKLLPCATRLMYRGLRINKGMRAQKTKEVEDILKQISVLLVEVGLGDINLRSPQQLKNMFYGLFQAPEQYSRATGNLSTDKEALRAIRESDALMIPVVDLLELYRSYSVLLNTFLKADLDIDGRMRCYYNIAGTDTFRFASKKNAFGTGLNLQNIPGTKDSTFGMTLPSVQELVIPDEGYTFFDADLSSADARIVMAECGSQLMKEIFESGEDLYMTLAGEYHGRRLDINNPDDKAIRKIFKAVAHATHYLGSAAGIAGRTGLLVRDVQKMQKWYFGANPELKNYHNKIKGWVDLRGYLQNVFGYRYYFLNSQRKTIYQQAAAWIPQSTIAILINKAMVQADETLTEKGVEVQLQVHDSFGGQYPTHKPELREEILECFKIPLEYPSGTLIIPADMNTSTVSWGGCK